MIRTTLAATATAVLTFASPAAAVTGRPAATLTLTYQSDAGSPATVKLTCGPAGGAHPRRVAACSALTRVNGKPARLKAPSTALCTMEYAPVTARITGTWKGRKLTWSHRFGNRCDLARTTGVLFAF